MIKHLILTCSLCLPLLLLNAQSSDVPMVSFASNWEAETRPDSWEQDQEELVVLRLESTNDLAKTSEVLMKENMKLMLVQQQVETKIKRSQLEILDWEQKNEWLEQDIERLKEERNLILNELKATIDENQLLLSTDEDLDEEIVRENREKIQMYGEKIDEYDLQIADNESEISANDFLIDELEDHILRHEELREACDHMVSSNELIIESSKK